MDEILKHCTTLLYFILLLSLICVLHKESHYCYVLSVHVLTASLSDVNMKQSSVIVKNWKRTSNIIILNDNKFIILWWLSGQVFPLAHLLTATDLLKICWFSAYKVLNDFQHFPKTKLLCPQYYCPRKCLKLSI